MSNVLYDFAHALHHLLEPRSITLYDHVQSVQGLIVNLETVCKSFPSNSICYFLHVLTNLAVLNSCLLFKMCTVYAHLWLFVFTYLQRSMYQCVLYTPIHMYDKLVCKLHSLCVLSHLVKCETVFVGYNVFVYMKL
jgi:hypothetical protein